MADEAKDSEVPENDLTLPPSRLGTKEYWDEAYEKERTNFEEIGDVGEIWFGENCMNRMVKWIKKSPRITKTSSMLDIGCGNGMLAIKLAEVGHTNITGVDYSEDAIQLAESIAKAQNVSVKFMECNILDLSSCSLSGQTFDVCLDKGTYDAISLNPQDSIGCRASYIQSIGCLLSNKGLFMITSCNWTKNELINHFYKDFSLFDEIPAPSFTFGGKSGNTVTSLVFERKTEVT